MLFVGGGGGRSLKVHINIIFHYNTTIICYTSNILKIYKHMSHPTLSWSPSTMYLIVGSSLVLGEVGCTSHSDFLVMLYVYRDSWGFVQIVYTFVVYAFFSITYLWFLNHLNRSLDFADNYYFLFLSNFFSAKLCLAKKTLDSVSIGNMNLITVMTFSEK